VDALTITFALFLSVICLVIAPHLSLWFCIICINVLASAGVIVFAQIAAGATDPSKLNVLQPGNPFLKIVYDWYPAPLVFLSYKEIYLVLQAVGMPDRDNVLIAIDRWIFGVHPTVWLYQFATPVVTEILEIAYASFYILMLVTGLEPYVRRENGKFNFFIFTFLYGFFLSYIGYLLVPGVGPRFTLHDFSALKDELPGIFCTDAIRDFLNAGESIPRNAANAIATVQRDVFPSGHTQMTLIVIYLAAKFKLRTRYFLFVFGTLLIIATVYLRYHYVVDLIAGAMFMVFTVWSAPKLYAWWERFRTHIEP
jgi:membrane-associated phospholipid phosphatase